jgi:hypothetical protein
MGVSVAPPQVQLFSLPPQLFQFAYARFQGVLNNFAPVALAIKMNDPGKHVTATDNSLLFIIWLSDVCVSWPSPAANQIGEKVISFHIFLFNGKYPGSC